MALIKSTRKRPSAETLLQVSLSLKMKNEPTVRLHTVVCTVAVSASFSSVFNISTKGGGWPRLAVRRTTGNDCIAFVQFILGAIQ